MDAEGGTDLAVPLVARAEAVVSRYFKYNSLFLYYTLLDRVLGVTPKPSDGPRPGKTRIAFWDVVECPHGIRGLRRWWKS